jgi:methylenetetrahydrofolate dehydrogenase (NADP+)/methenyltetrahydrofolate cyclohydrolase
MTSKAEPTDLAALGLREGAPGNGLIIDGKLVSQSVLAETAEKASALIARGVRPGLAVVLVGEDPASQVYVKSKGKAAESCGFHSVQHTLPATTSEADLVALVEALNRDAAIHGILVQLPLPRHINATRVLETISPAKDVDGFHPVNAGLLAIGDIDRALVPCTPAGSLILLERAAKALGMDLAGREAVVVGRSNIVGKPMAQLLLSKNCMVTIAHSRTHDLAEVVGRAEILVAAVGRPEMIRGEWVRKGAIVIDVGINRVPGEGLDAAGRPKTRLVGDVAYAGAAARAGAITPVPGGVGPMTIALLMANTLTAASRQAG